MIPSSPTMNSDSTEIMKFCTSRNRSARILPDESTTNTISAWGLHPRGRRKREIRIHVEKIIVHRDIECIEFELQLGGLDLAPRRRQRDVRI